MHNVHGFALISEALKHPAAPVMALFCEVHATALKAMHKAGRRGGDSIAREGDKHVCRSVRQRLAVRFSGSVSPRGGRDKPSPQKCLYARVLHVTNARLIGVIK